MIGALDYQVVLLPKSGYWKWVSAASKYIREFGANLTDDPASAIGYMAPEQVISFPVGDSLFPDHPDLEAWLIEAAPGIRLDPIGASNSKAFKKALDVRIVSDDRYGQKQKPFYLLWPTDYAVITQPFGANPQIYKRAGMPGHEGVDFRALTNTNVTCCAPGTVYEVHTNPKDHPYGIHVRVRHKDGYRTVYAHLARAMVQVGEALQAGQLLGRADSTGASTASHLHLTLERDGATARKETKYPKDVIDPTPFLVWPSGSNRKTLPAASWPAGRCLIGAVAPLDRKMTPGDGDRFVTAGLEAALVRSAMSAEEVAALRELRPGVLLVARLTVDFSTSPVTSRSFVSQVAADLRRLHQAGVRYFEVGSQPNVQSGGWGRSWHSGTEYAAWFEACLKSVRKIAPGARFGLPGLMPGPDTHGWQEDAWRFLAEAEPAARSADWLGIGCVWQGVSGIRHPEVLRTLKDYRQRYPDKLLFVTGFTNCGSDLTAESRAQQYLAFFRGLRALPGVGAAFVEDLFAGEAIPPAETQASPRVAEVLGSRDF